MQITSLPHKEVSTFSKLVQIVSEDGIKTNYFAYMRNRPITLKGSKLSSSDQYVTFCRGCLYIWALSL